MGIAVCTSVECEWRAGVLSTRCSTNGAADRWRPAATWWAAESNSRPSRTLAAQRSVGASSSTDGPPSARRASRTRPTLPRREMAGRPDGRRGARRRRAGGGAPRPLRPRSRAGGTARLRRDGGRVATPPTGRFRPVGGATMSGGQAVSTAMTTGTPLVMMSYTAERAVDCSTIRCSVCGEASPLTVKRISICW